VESQNEQIEKDLGLARRVHKTLVPDSVHHEKVDIWVSYIPMSYVSGDYAKIRFLDANRLLVFISDVTGHGVAAALLVNRVHAEFERLIQDRPEPFHLLSKLNEFIARDFEGTSMYLSAFCGLLDFTKGEFIYSNFGHPSQILYQVRHSAVKCLSSQNTLLGVAQEGLLQQQGIIPFEPGDRILLFTDGVIEAENDKGDSFGDQRLHDFMVRHDHVKDVAFNEKLVSELSSFRKGGFMDDIYILNILTKSAPSVAGESDSKAAGLAKSRW
jgi:phosphoserine phosphatase RsbU/P